MTSASERFWAKVDRDGPMPDPATGLTTCCYLWLGATSHGYGVVKWDGRQIGAHRTAWLLDGKQLPNRPLTLDHLCRNKACVRVSHLRVANQSQQQFNTDLYENNHSGVRGVDWDKKRGVWRVRVRHNYKSYFGGRFDDLSNAKAAYLALRELLRDS